MFFTTINVRYYVMDKNLIDLCVVSLQSFVNRGEIDSRMMSALLTGVNRAYPYAKSKFLGVNSVFWVFPDLFIHFLSIQYLLDSVNAVELI